MVKADPLLSGQYPENGLHGGILYLTYKGPTWEILLPVISSDCVDHAEDVFIVAAV